MQLHFWEEFDPEAPVETQYDMYGDRFGKSLCHAWAASPIYFLAKYFMGLKFTGVGGKEFVVEPHTEFFDSFDCTLPVAEGQVHIVWDGNELKVEKTAHRLDFIRGLWAVISVKKRTVHANSSTEIRKKQ